MHNFNDPDKPLSAKETAQLLNITVRSLYKLTHQKRIAFYKPNGKLLVFKRSDVLKYAFSNRINSDS